MSLDIKDLCCEPYTLTTDHAVSSYGMPVLVDSRGMTHGPGDILGHTTASEAVRNWARWASDMLTDEEAEFCAWFSL